MHAEMLLGMNDFAWRAQRLHGRRHLRRRSANSTLPHRLAHRDGNTNLARARVNWPQITCSSSLRSVMPSGNGTLSIDPWKPATAAVVEFLSGRDFMG